MTRHVALLRGVSPANAKMSELREAFASAGFEDVRTVLGSGNVIFSAGDGAEETLEGSAEEAMRFRLDRVFPAIVRTIGAIEEILAADPFTALGAPDGAKRVVTFLRAEPDPSPPLPVVRGGACIAVLSGREAFTYYEPGPDGPVFMALLGETFGKEITTRTWGTLEKIVRAAS